MRDTTIQPPPAPAKTPTTKHIGKLQRSDNTYYTHTPTSEIDTKRSNALIQREGLVNGLVVSKCKEAKNSKRIYRVRRIPSTKIHAFGLYVKYSYIPASLKEKTLVEQWSS